MKKTLLPIALLTLALNASADETLEPIADGPPQIISENAAVVLDTESTTAKAKEGSTALSTKIDETRHRGTGINEIRVKYKELPSYQLRREIGERQGEKSQSDIDSNTSLPQWQIGAW